MLLLLLLFLWVHRPIFLLFFFHFLDFELSQFLRKDCIVVFGFELITIKGIDCVCNGILIFLDLLVCFVLNVRVFLHLFLCKLDHQVAIMPRSFIKHVHSVGSDCFVKDDVLNLTLCPTVVHS